MHKIKKTYDSRTILLDFDFLDLKNYTVDEELALKKLLNKLTAHQNLVFLTNNSWSFAQKNLDLLGIKSGYLIADAGVSITKIASKEVISDGTLDPKLVKVICYRCMWSNLYFSLCTEAEKFSYRTSTWIINRYKADFPFPESLERNTIFNSKDLKEWIDKRRIRNIEIYFLGDLESRKKNMNSFIETLNLINFQNFDYLIHPSCLYVIPKGYSKLVAIEKLSKEVNLPIQESCLYLGISQIDKEISSNSYITVITCETQEKQDLLIDNSWNHSELIPWGNSSWVNWMLIEHSHLWRGDSEESLRELSEKYKNSSISQKDLENFQNKSCRYLYFESESSKSKIFFWADQVPYISKFVEGKKNL